MEQTIVEESQAETASEDEHSVELDSKAPESDRKEVKTGSEEEVVSKQAIATVLGEAVVDMPLDLYIPPEAMRVFLEAFEGPLDLLLYLIKKQNLDILDIPIADITRQYMSYIDVMKELKLELAAEYLLMAAMLAEIKSRMLLPRPEADGDDEGNDPRAELVRRLQEYERFKKASEDLRTLSRLEKDNFVAMAAAPPMKDVVEYQPIVMEDLTKILAKIFARAKLVSKHEITAEVMSIRDRMTRVLSAVNGKEFVSFTELFDVSEGRMGVVVTFIAILELTRQSILELTQGELFGQVYVKARAQMGTSEIEYSIEEELV